MDIYFKLPHIGDLVLEHEFYSLGNDPILFVCKDKADLRYLCSCCHIGDEWVVGQVREENLIDLIDDRVSIRAVFEACDPLFFVVWNGENFCLKFDIPDEAFPQAGAFLELEEEKEGAFRELVKNAARQRKTNCAMIAAYQTVLPHMQSCMQVSQYIANISQALLSVTPALQEISRYLSVIDTAQIQKIVDTVAQCIDQPRSLQLEDSSHVNESIITIVAKDNIIDEKLCEDNRIYRYAA